MSKQAKTSKMKNAKVQVALKDLKTVDSFLTDSNLFLEDPMVELINAMNRLMKSRLSFAQACVKLEPSDMYYHAMQIDKLELIKAISNF